MAHKDEEEQGLFDIDIYNLEEEWMRQPKMFGDYSEQLADARKEMNEAKAELELTQATLSNRIRKNPVKYKIEGRVTEGGISEAVLCHPRYRDALASFNEARHKVDLLEGVVKTLDQRKRALENLVDLHGQQYFSVPATKNKELKEAVDRQSKSRSYRRAKFTGEEDE